MIILISSPNNTCLKICKTVYITKLQNRFKSHFSWSIVWIFSFIQPILCENAGTKKNEYIVFNINVHCARYLSTMIILNTDYRRPISLFSLKFQTLSHGRQIGQIKLGAFGVFLAILSALISVLCVPCPCFHSSTIVSTNT